jgi:hypothetical protein
VVELALGGDHRAEALDRHVGKREQVIEFDAETVSGHTPVIFAKGGPAGAVGIAHEIEDEPGFLVTITQRIKTAQPSDRTFERPLMALPVHVFFQAARQRCASGLRHRPVAARYAMLRHKPYKGGCP